MSTFRMESQVAKLTFQVEEELARLFFEQAVEVYERTGRMPKQIADERDELQRALQRMLYAFPERLHEMPGAVAFARAVIAKTTGKDVTK